MVTHLPGFGTLESCVHEPRTRGRWAGTSGRRRVRYRPLFVGDAMIARLRALPALTAAVAVALAAAASLPGYGDAMPTQTTTPPVAEKDRWNLTELYATDAVWSQAKVAFEKKIE